MTDFHYMALALAEAQKAFEEKEVPVGAVVVLAGRVIGRGHNRIESLQDATAHAEIIALSSAANTLETWRLNECELYVTLEPCMMCCGAILQSRIGRVVFGAADPRYGACVSKYRLFDNNCYHQKVELLSEIMAEESSHLLKEFFKNLRRNDKEENDLSRK